ncbi:MAG: hypothetical protein ABIR15_03510 [Chitinophagaceae bacterium]
MNISKIQLSAEELQLVTNSEWILTKHRIIEKVYQLFGTISGQMQHYLQERKILHDEVMQLPPKISKGEQYEALPYVVLDYPRLFSKEDVFAIRSFFWWGNYFSITLHLKGKFYQQYYKKIAAAAAAKKLQGYYLSFSGSEFSFNLEGKNYFLANDTMSNGNKEMEQPSFLKISYKISFEHWDIAEQKLMQIFMHFITLAED